MLLLKQQDIFYQKGWFLIFRKDECFVRGYGKIAGSNQVIFLVMNMNIQMEEKFKQGCIQLNFMRIFVGTSMKYGCHKKHQNISNNEMLQHLNFLKYFYFLHLNNFRGSLQIDYSRF
ncbi:Uncharacterised protein [Kluyvera cryocrescens]|uniref:Uncharacterized protein n=1 Tax=Kluyvera cryocrescens TaxID=580 RepID=A0A485CVJ2_KLUCR|nr:Uncharacterised protein [Kluyvera cryocrescens]